jgi:hypothetical protein
LTDYSQKYNFGKLAGLILGVTIGAFGVNYAYNRFYLHKMHIIYMHKITRNLTFVKLFIDINKKKCIFI